jgi:hypothetical protein
MKTNVLFIVPRQFFFLEREMFQTNIVQNNKTNILDSLAFSKIMPFMR